MFIAIKAINISHLRCDAFSSLGDFRQIVPHYAATLL